MHRVKIDDAQNLAQNSWRNRGQWIDGKSRRARQTGDPVIDPYQSLLLRASPEDEADDGDPREHIVKGINRNERAPHINDVAREVDRAVDRQSNRLAMHGAIAEHEAAAIALETHLQPIESDGIGVDLLRPPSSIERRGAFANEPSQCGFVMQDKIVDDKDTVKLVRAKNQARRDLSALHVVVEVEER
jgi:hypothetical protein